MSDGESVLKAIRKAVVQMDEAEVPAEERYLFITPTLHGPVGGYEFRHQQGGIESICRGDSSASHPFLHRSKTENRQGWRRTRWFLRKIPVVQN